MGLDPLVDIPAIQVAQTARDTRLRRIPDRRGRGGLGVTIPDTEPTPVRNTPDHRALAALVAMRSV